jgi:hypothetical protein
VNETAAAIATLIDAGYSVEFIRRIPDEYTIFANGKRTPCRINWIFDASNVDRLLEALVQQVEADAFHIEECKAIQE